MKLNKQMKQFCLAATVLAAGFASVPVSANQPDSLYLYTYGLDTNGGREGLRGAWSADGKLWKQIGPGHDFVRCDYGRWGSEKRLWWPFVIQDQKGGYHAFWSLNDRDGAFSYAYSEDLINWKPQSYPVVMKDGGNCLQPEASYDAAKNQYLITWLSVQNGDTAVYATTTSDFRKYAPAYKTTDAARLNTRQRIGSVDPGASGTIHRVPAGFVRTLENEVYSRRYKDRLFSENARSDASRFADLKPLEATLTLNASETRPISPLLMGIFFEDISSAADGGLYAELIQNRDFEYALSDKEGRDENWNPRHSWSVKGGNATFEIATDQPIHPNNPHYAVFKVDQPGAALANVGFDGIALKKGDKYNFSLFSKQLEGKSGKLKISLVGQNGEVYATAQVAAPSSSWKKYTAVLTSNADVKDAILQVEPLAAGTVAMDMISLFPQKTYKGRANGLRPDLAEVIADLKPQFVRFPGGCVAHGDGIGNIYRWKNSIGPLEARVPMRNLWGYHQTLGLGYHEYFLFCEDLGAIPVPVLAAGVPCQNSATGGGGQQCGIPMEEMGEYIQDIFDLVEYANGDAKTTKWGKLRAEAGHPKPFNLKYIGIGNEDLISDVFAERFEMIFKAMKEKHPEIVVIGTAGPFNEGSDYDEGWRIGSELGVPILDEHYYQSPGWFIHNQDYYDMYDRNKPAVYLGEWASRGNTLYNALAEAAYLCAIERNADIVVMTSYAPLLAKEHRTNWNPDLIYFNNTEIKPTPNYYVQMLFGQHTGTEYLAGNLTVSDRNEGVTRRIASSIIRSEEGDLIVKLVNILPTAVSTRVSLQGEGPVQPEATKIVLTGESETREARPVTTTMQVSEEFDVELPAYSFTVIRIKK